MVDRAIRNLDRERAGMQKQEQILINDIKKAAKAGQLVRTRCGATAATRTALSPPTHARPQKSARIMAKDLVRIRKHQEKFVGLTAQLRAISLEMTVGGRWRSAAEAARTDRARRRWALCTHCKTR
jgi:charged multivesicular body protein 2A